jgi:hypothetical protein
MTTEPVPLPPDEDFVNLLARVRGGDDDAAAELVVAMSGPCSAASAAG